MIPYGRQSISQADIEAVERVLRSDFLTQGPVVPKFEAALAQICRTKHGVAVNSATSALHIACLALDLGPGDWLWTSPITFVASANCAIYCGAQVDFVDIDPKTFNLDPKALELQLEQAEKQGRLPKVVVAVHMCGQSCDMRQIAALSKRYGFKIIEDASHAVGATYLDEPVGQGRYSDIAVMSFHPVKIVTTAEGGMALTQDDTLAKRMQLLRSHGITRDPKEMVHEPQGPWVYEQIDLGFNYRMTDMQAALGMSQLERLAIFLEQRNSLAQRYIEKLDHLEVLVPFVMPEARSSWHLFVVQIDFDRLKKSRREVVETFHRQHIGVNVHYMPVYRQPFYQKMGYDPSKFPCAEAYYARALTLPLYPGLSFEMQDQVIDALTQVMTT